MKNKMKNKETIEQKISREANYHLGFEDGKKAEREKVIDNDIQEGQEGGGQTLSSKADECSPAEPLTKFRCQECGSLNEECYCINCGRSPHTKLCKWCGNNELPI